MTLYEDRDLLIIDKPPRVVSSDLPFFPAHRLDKDTSGVLAIAKTSEALYALQEQWKKRTVKKEYIALVRGVLPLKGRIDAPLTRSQKDRKKISVSSSPRSRSSQTEFALIKSFSFPNVGVLSLARVFPQTGRTHQIRVHFSAIHHPIVGDALYGDLRLNKKFLELGLSRQFLHASKLTFKHPRTKKSMQIESKLPEDLEKILSLL